MEEFNWKQYWNTNAAGKRKRERVKQRKKEKILKPKKKKLIIPTSSQWAVFEMYHEGKKYNEVQYNTHIVKIQEHLNEPVERYEIKDKTIIRTVSTFHYLSKQMAVNGICRSFHHLTKRRIGYKQLHGKEKIFNVYDDIIDEFNRRYYMSRPLKADYSQNDLDKDINVSRIIIARNHYVFVSIKDKFTDTWGKAKMFRLTQRPERPSKYRIEPYLSQEQIIEKIKSGHITGVHKFGNPNEVYSNEQVLEIIG